MTVPLRIVTPAQRDLIQMTTYLVDRVVRVAARFRRAVKVSLDRLRKKPDLGALWPTSDDRLTGLRAWAVRGFPHHLLFHRHANGEVVVLRVLHTSQDAFSIFGGNEELDAK